MSLQLILGNSGSGKSTKLYNEVINKSIEFPDINYIVVVPEQFTMSTQRELVMKHPNKGIMNIDVVSFQRLAYRIFEETGADSRIVLEDTGKNLILKKIAEDKKSELVVLKNNLSKIGYISEVKSFISELTQYKISPEDIKKLAKDSVISDSLNYKLKDLLLVYRGFKEYMSDTFITAEEILELLADVVEDSELIRKSVLVMDGFTGFTPIQYKLIEKLIQYAKKVIITVTVDTAIDLTKAPLEHELFKLSKNTIFKLNKTANDVGVKIDDPIILKNEDNQRFKKNGGLSFLEKNIFRYNSNKYCEVQDEISIHVSKNPEEEIEFAAREITKLVSEKNYRYKDIAIVTGDIGLYGRYALDILPSYNIPFFVDYKRDILQNPFVESIRAVLEIISTDFKYEPVFRYLKSGMSNLDIENINLLENYCLAYGKRGFSQWKKEWKGKSGFNEEEVEIVNKVREKVASCFIDIVPVLKDKSTTVREKTIALYEFIKEQKYQENIKKYEENFKTHNQMSLAKEYSQVYKIVIDLFDKIVELLGNDEMVLKEYSAILDAGFAEAKIGIIPPGLDMLQIGDIERSRLNNIKVLFFVGVNDGVIPANDSGGGIISQTEREVLLQKIEIAPTIREKSFIQRFYLYVNMTKPQDKLYLSYSKISSDGKTLRASYLINNIRKMFSDINIVDEEKVNSLCDCVFTINNGFDFLAKGFDNSKENLSDCDWNSLFEWFINDEKYKNIVRELTDAAFLENTIEWLEPDIARALYGELIRNSVTRLERYSRCAFAHFLKYGLKLEERKEYSFESSDMGTIIHNALDIFSKDLNSSGYSWVDVPDDIRQKLVEDSINASVKELDSDILYSNSRNEYMLERMKRILGRTAWALSEQMKKGSFTTENSETFFTTAHQMLNPKTQKLFELCLMGRIDRIDTCKNGDEMYVKIIDYKTGVKEFSINEFYYGLSLQLVIYMNAAVEKLQEHLNENKVIPAGIFYYNIKDPVVEGNLNMSPNEAEQKILNELRMNGIVNNRKDIISKFDRDFDTKSSVIPVSRTKNGELSKTSSVASDEQFKMLSEYANIKVRDVATEMMSGNINIYPYEFDGGRGCDYCEYSSVCKFDRKLTGFSYNKLDKLGTDDLWRVISETIGGDEKQ